MMATQAGDMPRMSWWERLLAPVDDRPITLTSPEERRRRADAVRRVRSAVETIVEAEVELFEQAERDGHA